MRLHPSRSNDREFRFAHDVTIANEEALTEGSGDDDLAAEGDGAEPCRLVITMGPGVTTITTDREPLIPVGARSFKHISRKELDDYLEGSRHLEHGEMLRYEGDVEYTKDVEYLDASSVVRIADAMERLRLRPKFDITRLSSRFDEYVFQVC